MIIYVLVLCSFAVATAEFVLVGLLPQIAADLSVSVPAAGQLVTAYMVVGSLGGPVATVLTRRLPRRGLLAATMALAALSAAGCAVAGSYGLLLAARLGSALAQALFMAAASQVAMGAVPAERQTAAVARVFGGFALATVIGLPLGTLVGRTFGWHAAFLAVAGLAGAGLLGVAAFCPRIPAQPATGLRQSAGVLARPAVLAGLAVTLLTLTGFVTTFTYVAPMLQTVTRLRSGWVSAGLVCYGVGTVAGTLLAGRVPPAAILRWLPGAVGALAVTLLLQRILLPVPALALAGLAVLGTAAFLVVPLVQTWLMSQAGTAAAGLVAAVNVSVAGAAGALGAALGGAALSAGLGLAWLGTIAAVPVLAAAATAIGLGRRRATPSATTALSATTPSVAATPSAATPGHPRAGHPHPSRSTPDTRTPDAGGSGRPPVLSRPSILDK